MQKLQDLRKATRDNDGTREGRLWRRNSGIQNHGTFQMKRIYRKPIFGQSRDDVESEKSTRVKFH